MQKHIRLSIVTACLSLALLAGVPSLALGAPGSRANAEETETTSEGTGELNGTATGQNTAASEKKEAKQIRLAEKKLDICQKREKAITNIMSRVSDRGQKQLDLFGSIAEKTQKFYENKALSLDTYDALLADVAAQKASAQDSVDAIKSTITEFKCGGTDPKGAASSFKEALRLETDALKAYKTSVKNLIVGVKSAQEAATPSDNEIEGDNQ